MKRDSAFYNYLKDGNNWDSWRRHLIAIARAQDVDDVLNLKYSPTNQEDVDLFSEK